MTRRCLSVQAEPIEAVLIDQFIASISIEVDGATALIHHIDAHVSALIFHVKAMNLFLLFLLLLLLLLFHLLLLLFSFQDANVRRYRKKTFAFLPLLGLVHR